MKAGFARTEVRSASTAPSFVLAVLLVLGLSAGPIQAQEWTARVGAGVFLDPQFALGTEVGPSLVVGLTRGLGGRFGVGLDLTAARTDFTLQNDEWHRSLATGTVALRFATGSPTALQLSVGLGVTVEDDVNETDRAVTSSARMEELLATGPVR